MEGPEGAELHARNGEIHNALVPRFGDGDGGCDIDEKEHNYRVDNDGYNQTTIY